ncbi:hypothetical protein JB92DRAFT_2733475 [Gautieria morchelliformis]|nr:hypothetical protein JB92DRAFT_2733475 [Gautieria morchelliformis]
MVSPVDPPATGINTAVNPSNVLNSGAGISPAASSTSSPGPSRESLTVPDVSRTSIDDSKPKFGKPPMRLSDESPHVYLSRLIEAVSKAEVAHVLAASGDDFHAQALRSYIGRFNFTDDPLDVALRKLLMELGLPRETQQIDRVMEAFAARYVACNSGLFLNDDHPYILAFSLIMLHTDAFNKSNKNKMTKADYVKNTKLDGIPPEILECFFDNIIFAPFIFIEDPMDAKGHLHDGGSRLNSINGPITSSSGVVNNAGGSTILGKANKIDPYYLITQNLLGPLRPEVHLHIPKLNPFLYEGTDWPWDTQRLHHLFALAQLIQVQVDVGANPSVSNGTNSALSTPSRRKSIVLPSLTVGYGPFMGSPPFSSEGLASPPRILNGTTSHAQGVRTLRIARAGILARKEDTIEGGKKATSRKWRVWSVVLSGTQLLFFRDLNFASHLLGLPPTEGVQGSTPDLGVLNPDEVVSLYECIAVFDTSYRKASYANAFRFVMPNGRQFIMQASDERSLNDWISAINYAGAFKSAGVQMRGSGMSYKDVEKTGVAAATSHLQDLRASSKATTVPNLPSLLHTYDSPDASRNTVPPSSDSLSRHGTGAKMLKPFNGISNQLDLETSVSRQLEGAKQFKATFDEVKAELAAHNAEQLRPSATRRSRTLSMGNHSSIKQPSRPGTAGSASKSEDMNHGNSPALPSRNDTIQSCVDTLDARINRVQRDLDAELRVARNLAILTPFQRATRDRIQVAVASLAKKVRIMRIDLARLVCYRFVLLTDLAQEEREWEQAKRDALKAATQRLHAYDVNRVPEHGQHSQRSHLHEDPSTTESFYSAFDGMADHHKANVSTPLSMHSESDNTEFPFLPDSSSSLHRDDNAAQSPPSHTQSDLGSSPAGGGHERYYTAVETPEEIAEVWNETRAAKRVSLVRLPSDVKFSSLLGRQMKYPDVGSREGSSDNPSFTPNQSIATEH